MGTRIKELRERQGISQEQLAAAVESTGATVSEIESGKRYPRVKLLSAIADYFGVSTDYLLGRGATEGDLSPELRELFDAARKAGYAANLKEFFDWLAAKRNKLVHEVDSLANEELMALVPELSKEDVAAILTKYDKTILHRMAKLTPEQRATLNAEIARVLRYLELEEIVERSKGETARNDSSRK